MGKLELAIIVGAESKQWLAELSNLINRLEKAAASGIKRATTASQADAVTEEAKPARRASKPKAEEDESFDLDAGEAAMEQEEEPVVTIKEVIAACKANREVAIKVLKKLKVNSVHELKPTQYGRVMSEIGA